MGKVLPVGRVGAPVYDVEFYSDEFIRDPFPHYEKMRALGPVVYIPHLNNYAVTQYAEAREVLHDWKRFSSVNAIPADEAGCAFLHGASNLVSDPPVHDEVRAIMAAPLLPNTLKKIRLDVEASASELIARLVDRGGFDGMLDLARYLPESLVTELVGLPEDGRENMLNWAAAAFDITGIQNERGQKGAQTLGEMREWIVTKATPDNLKPGSLTANIRDKVAKGEIPEELFLGIMNDYITPALDTTISATGEILLQLGRNPDQWELLRNDPSLIESAINEGVRFGSPIRSFTRRVMEDVELGGVNVPAQSRLMVIYASANRDERKFPNADKFDVTRNASDHVGFGHGIHMCVGMHLAKLEMASLLKAMIEQVETIQVGEPIIAMNNTIHSYSQLPTQFTKAEVQRRAKVSVVEEVSPVDESWIDTIVTSRAEGALGIVVLEFAAPSGAKLPAYEAGAHIDVEIGSNLVRQYSLCDDPSTSETYRIAVLREPESRGGSIAVHDNINIGSKVRISQPRNFFELADGAHHSVLLAGGIGITPILAMAHKLKSTDRSFELHYASRSRDRMAFFEEIFQTHLADQAEAHFDDGPEEQRFNAEAILRAAPNGAHLYCCGPAGFIDYVVATAESLGWSEECVHVERFSATPIIEGAPFDVVAARSGRTFHVPCDKSIMQVLYEAGIKVPSSCHSGVCATCVTNVVSGVPEHRDMVLTPQQRADNSVIAVCCSRSKTDRLVLDI
tara:strand:+ start:1484 stop:3691 length:2208 start_codon:yes stop_codon:yes gene_type:complete